MVILCYKHLYVHGVDVEFALEGTIEGFVRDRITLFCDLQGLGAGERIWFKGPFEYLTSGEDILETLPSDVRFRLSVTCSNKQESCSLTISSLKFSDSGEYTCGYESGGARTQLASAILTVIDPVPPSESSPICSLYKFEPSRYNEVTSDMVHIGDRLGLKCCSYGGNPRPTIYATRGGQPITNQGAGCLTWAYNVSESDFGMIFTCVMSHASLSQPRTCLFLDLQDTMIQAQTTTGIDVSEFSTKPLVPDDVTRAPNPNSSTDFTHRALMIILIVVGVFFASVILFVLLAFFYRKKIVRSLRNHGNDSIRRRDMNAAHYTVPSPSETQRHEYEPLKAPSLVTNAVPHVDEYAYPRLTDQTRTVARIGSELYADVHHNDQKTVGKSESADNRPLSNTPADTALPLAYANLQRPVKALNFNT